jgi:hypothetical protein
MEHVRLRVIDTEFRDARRQSVRQFSRQVPLPDDAELLSLTIDAC